MRFSDSYNVTVTLVTVTIIFSYNEVASKRTSDIQEEFQKKKRQKLGEDYKVLQAEITPTILQSFR